MQALFICTARKDLSENFSAAPEKKLEPFKRLTDT
jgi:hypothetical protein